MLTRFLKYLMRNPLPPNIFFYLFILMINAIIVGIVVFIVIINLLENREHFVNLNTLNDNNKKISKFCRRLKQFNKPSEHTLMLRNFHQRKLKSNNKIISEILKEIEYLQKDKYHGDIEKINSYKCKLQKNAKKQIDVINKAKNNIENRNTLNVNVTNY